MRKEVLGILCSGRGTNLDSIIKAQRAGEIRAEIAVVLTDKPEAKALERAAAAGIAPAGLARRACAPRGELAAKLGGEAGVTRGVRAGFMRILSPYFARRFCGRILNIHPSLLPSFGGAHAHRDVLAYGVKVSGCTIHFVDEGMDSGPIILQTAVPVLDDDTEDTLAARVLQEEHILYPRAIALYVDGRLKVEGRQVTILE